MAEVLARNLLLEETRRPPEPSGVWARILWRVVRLLLVRWEARSPNALFAITTAAGGSRDVDDRC